MAFSVLLAVALLAAASAAPESRGSSRIVGGTFTPIEEFPYIVAIMYTYTGPGITVQRCVGCLLSSWHVLTTGFCFTGAIEENMKIRAGSTNSLSGGTLVSLNGFIKHPDYLETPRRGDVAVTFLQTPLGLTGNINVLYLPPEGTYIPVGTETRVVSWGFENEGGTQLEQLKSINLYKMAFEECQAVYAGNDKVEISEKVICASAPGRGMCQGDSGAPMVIGQTVVGISSYYEECGNDSIPDVFTRVDSYTNWILSVATAPGRDAASRPRVATL